MKRSLIAGLMLVVLGVSGNIARAQGGSSCDRECLRGFVTQYLNAMVAHNPAALTTAPNVRFTEDTQTLKLGKDYGRTPMQSARTGWISSTFAKARLCRTSSSKKVGCR
jgi:hypothetical protein